MRTFSRISGVLAQLGALDAATRPTIGVVEPAPPAPAPDDEPDARPAPVRWLAAPHIVAAGRRSLVVQPFEGRNGARLVGVAICEDRPIARIALGSRALALVVDALRAAAAVLDEGRDGREHEREEVLDVAIVGPTRLTFSRAQTSGGAPAIRLVAREGDVVRLDLRMSLGSVCVFLAAATSSFAKVAGRVFAPSPLDSAPSPPTTAPRPDEPAPRVRASAEPVRPKGQPPASYMRVQRGAR